MPQRGGSAVLSGDAEEADVLDTKTFYSDNPSVKQTGSAYINTMSPSEDLLLSADATRYDNYLTWTKRKQMNIYTKGTWRTKFTIWMESTGDPGQFIIRKNDVQYGTLRQITSATPVTFSEDLAWVNGDFNQGWIRMTGGTGTICVKDYRVYGEVDPGAVGMN